MILKSYTLSAAAGREAELLQALRDLAAAVLAAGSEGVDIWRDAKEAGSFTFLERWASLDQYEAASGAVPKALFAPLMAALSTPPVARTLVPAGD